ncbi:MAG: hypothetical protein IJU91_07170 [Selenomonadaceae bacterium]|nr:hypothetical protein [Selenomonadaceae bacterium]
MATAVEVMKNFFTVLKDFSDENGNYVGEIALDKAVRAVSTMDDFKTSVSIFKAALTADGVEGYSELDSDTRLEKVTGMVIGANYDYEADTGAISGSNAGGAVKKNAADIVPESGDLSVATLPAEGSTTQITYTGDDGKSFTFNVKWPESFSKFVSGTAVDSTTDPNDRMKDSRFLVDLNDFDENEAFYSDYRSLFTGNATYGDMKKAELTIIKGLNTYWLKEGAKLIYDSYGLDFDGKTIEIQLIADGDFGDSQFTTARNTDSLPSDNLIIGFNLATYGKIDETNPNGLCYLGSHIRKFLDRTVAHEMVHAAMLASGTLKLSGMPKFFIEGVADLIQGDDDFNAEHTAEIRYFFQNSDTLVQALSYDESNGSSYSAGDAYLRFIAKAAADTNIFVGTDENKNQTINFDGNTTIITNYDESNTINYATNFVAAGLSDTFNDFIALSSTETEEGTQANPLIIRDVRGKTISFANPDGGRAYAYMAENAGEINGEDFGDGNQLNILFGADNVNNVIRAGNGGSQLWGGYLGDDELYGGAGVDTFIYDINGGNDTVHNAESQDIVLLRNVNLSQISSAQITDNGVNLSFTYGGSLNILGQPSTFQLEQSDVSYTVDYQNKTWNNA